MTEPDRDRESAEAVSTTSLAELARLFFRLGATAFGGPAAHVAMMRDEVVRRRAWLTDAAFADLLGAANVIPGPTSTELAIHVGFSRRRFWGLVVAGLAFIVPAMLITSGLAWAYVRFGALPTAQWLLYGVKPVVLAIVVQAIWELAPTTTRTPGLRSLALCAAVLAVLGAHELVVLFGMGAGWMLVARARRSGRAASSIGWPLLTLPTVAAATAVTLPSLFWVFLEIGSVLFGSGYVLLVFLRAQLVEQLGWLTEGQLIDAVAVGQLTPGPVFTTATFIGWVLAGPGGALVATAGIFLPAFFFVALSGPLLPRIRASASASAFLDGVNAASIALMAVVTVALGRAAVVDLPTALLGLASAVILVRFRPNTSWLVLGGALVGWVLHAVAGIG